MIYFIGAGPGDPELITIKGKKKLDTADVVIYAGSLVNKQLLDDVKGHVKIYNSASLTLEEVIDIMEKAVEEKKTVARVHTGDPSIYGAIREQIDILEQRGLQYEVIPGVSSFVAAAAAINKEFTLPGITQTVILTRMEGRTGVPEKESLEKLAQHKASMCIFLSVHMIDEVVERLAVHYPMTTPAAVIQKATWEDQKIVLGTLMDISEKVKTANINKTAQILVGNFLGDEYELSKLYDKSFSHEYRMAIK